jgi:putative GTP pyrophosphokinase
VSPRRPDPFKPAPGATFSKRQVDRAGRLILAFQTHPAPTDEVWDHFKLDDVLEAYRAVTWWRSLHARPLTKVAANLRYHVAQEGGFLDDRIDVTQRLKRRTTMVNKLEREPTMEITQMHDIGGVRARLPSIKHVHAVSRRLRKTWTIHRSRDYVASPKQSGYRALHHIVRRDGYKIEVQLRTVRQDAWANQVEDDGRQTGIGLKFGRGATELHEYYIAMSAAFAHMDAGEPLPASLVTEIQQRYASIKHLLPRD